MFLYYGSLWPPFFSLWLSLKLLVSHYGFKPNFCFSITICLKIMSFLIFTQFFVTSNLFYFILLPLLFQFRLINFACCWFANAFFVHFCFFLLNLLRNLVSYSFSKLRKNGLVWFQLLKVWILVQLFHVVEIRRNWCLEVVHNLHHTMFQSVIYLEAYKFLNS